MTDTPIFATLVLLIYAGGFLCACSALLNARTPQGATAWVMSLITLPFLSIPFFLLFGRSRFEGYTQARRLADQKVIKEFAALNSLDASYLSVPDEMKILNQTIARGNQPGFTRGNSIKLLIDGEETYQSMLDEIKKAKEYIIIQFYIFRSDHIGMTFAELLMEKAEAGIKVHFLHDNIGQDIDKSLVQLMVEKGIQFTPFNDKNLKTKIQVNFRNHRKVLVVDGRVGFIGGLNIGDDYLGRWKTAGPWRDTHARIEGPSVIAAQLATAKDWYCSRETTMDVPWKLHPSQGDSHVLVLHTGPADDRHTCLLAHLALINSATDRLWISSAYFVPPESLMDAILLASLRGVDVRVLLPSYSDSRTVIRASRVYQERLLDHGIKVYTYSLGFLHQKVMLVDKSFGVVGSVNFDCRSMFINFEICAISTDAGLIDRMEGMLTEDFNQSRLLKKSDFKKMNLLDKILDRGANLLAPVL